ncbi:unnamed protein product [Larinioides sclopetarius]|uniref:LAGLIDADG homing endonuclease n=1 Tax=Larinioides sclopetarius TaxID=280406 RepID=A0AAV1ZKY8_9ARAC
MEEKNSDLLLTPSVKKDSKFKREYPFPIVTSVCKENESDPNWKIAEGYLDDNCVLVHDEESMKMLYCMGFFGKGTLSKNAPKICFQKMTTVSEKQKYTAFLHFESEKFAMTVSLKDCPLLVKLFYKNNDCAPVALQKFQTLKGMKKGVGPMTMQGLLKLIQKFEKTGSFAVQSGRGRKRIDSMVVEEVALATAVQEESSGGVQPCSVHWELPEH